MRRALVVALAGWVAAGVVSAGEAADGDRRIGDEPRRDVVLFPGETREVRFDVRAGDADFAVAGVVTTCGCVTTSPLTGTIVAGTSAPLTATIRADSAAGLRNVHIRIQGRSRGEDAYLSCLVLEDVREPLASVPPGWRPMRIPDGSRTLTLTCAWQVAVLRWRRTRRHSRQLGAHAGWQRALAQSTDWTTPATVTESVVLPPSGKVAVYG